MEGSYFLPILPGVCYFLPPTACESIKGCSAEKEETKLHRMHAETREFFSFSSSVVFVGSRSRWKLSGIGRRQ